MNAVAERKLSKWKAEVLNKIPRTTLTVLLNEKYSVTLTVLTIMEIYVADWAVEMSRPGISVSRNCLLDIVLRTMKDDQYKNPFKDVQTGEGWFAAFLKSHPCVGKKKTPGSSDAVMQL